MKMRSSREMYILLNLSGNKETRILSNGIFIRVGVQSLISRDRVGLWQSETPAVFLTHYHHELG